MTRGPYRSSLPSFICMRELRGGQTGRQGWGWGRTLLGVPRRALPEGRSHNTALGLTLPLCSVGIPVGSSMGQPPWLMTPSPPAQFWTPRPQKSPGKPAQAQLRFQ